MEDLKGKTAPASKSLSLKDADIKIRQEFYQVDAKGNPTEKLTNVTISVAARRGPRREKIHASILASRRAFHAKKFGETVASEFYDLTTEQVSAIKAATLKELLNP